MTAKSQILDVALEHFAEHGVKGATMRAIADRAGVSLGLVQHHFGSKEGLRDACDAYAVAFIRQEAKHAVEEDGIDDPGYIAEAMRNAPPVLRYLGRALVDGSPGAATIFDELVGVTESYLGERQDARADAAVFTAMRLGVYVLHEHLSRSLGADAFSAQSLARIGGALLNVVSPDFVGRDLVDRARTGLDKYTQEG